MKIIRQWHAYIGLFIGPSVLFFALTGAVQLFSLHEAHGSYKPPVIVEKLSSVHKDQVFALGDHHGDPGGAARPTTPVPGHTEGEDADEPKPSTVVLKAYFLIVALFLTLSTGFGLWMGLTQTRNKRSARILVAAGTLIPATLLLL